MQNYKTQDGLPSNEVYDIAQDNDGFIWFATDAGVSRFNGSDFQNFSLAEGLPDPVIFEVVADEQGTIWVVGMNRHVAYFKNERFYPYVFNDTIDKYTMPRALVEDVHIEGGAVQLIFKRASGALYIDSVGNTTHVDRSKAEKEQFTDYYVRGDWVSKYSTAIGLSQRIFPYDFLVHVYVHTGKLPNADSTKFDVALRRRWGGVGGAVVLNDMIVTSFMGGISGLDLVDKEIVKLKNAEVLNYQSIHRLVKKNDSAFYAISLVHGIFEMEIRDDSLVTTGRILEGENCNDIYVDRQGGVWIATYKHGVYHFNEIGLHTLIPDQVAIRHMRKADRLNDVLVSREDFSSFFIKEGGAVLEFAGNTLNKNITYPLRINNDGTIIFGSIDGWHVADSRTGQRSRPFSTDLVSLKIVTEIQNRIFVYSYNQDFYELHRNDQLETTVPFSRGVVNCVTEHNGSVFFGTSNGVFQTEDITDLSSLSIQEGSGGMIVTCMYSYEGVLFIGTKTHGLHALEKGRLRQVAPQRFLSKKITSITVGGDRLFVGTNQGVCIVDIKNMRIGFYSCITVNNGLASNDITALEVLGSDLLIGSKLGLQSIPLDISIKAPSIPKVFITSVLSKSGAMHDPDSIIKLHYNDAPLRIQYQGLDVSSKQRFEYRYKWGAEGAYFSTRSSELFLPNLEVGESKLFLAVKNMDGVWSEEKGLILHVQEPFWRSLVFWLLLAVCVSATFWYLSWRRGNVVRQEIEMQNRIVELRAKAIRAQMNPHFIFNCLNSIQGFILAHDTKRSINYLGQFAGLVRHVLDSSEKTEITIKAEVEHLRAYLEIEKMRFDSRFEYEIDVEPSVDLRTKIPAMLIQPYVENSVWHGLQNASHEGKIFVTFSAKGKHLYVNVIDNGVGRDQAQINKERERRSVGMTLTEERLKLVKGEGQGEVFVEDLFDEQRPSGTRVELKIPV